MSETAENRRPIKSRSWGVFQALATFLAKTPVTPNMISASSIAFGVLAGIALALTSQTDSSLYQRVFWVLAAVGIQGRLIANLLDGMVAIEGGKASAVGDLYNEVPDRVSDSAIFIGAGLAMGSRLDLGLAAALVAVFVAYVRAMGASVGVGQVFLGPMAKPHRMALMTISCCLLAVLPSNWQWMHADSGIGLMGITLALIIFGGVVTAIRRLNEIAARMRTAAFEKAGQETDKGVASDV